MFQFDVGAAGCVRCLLQEDGVAGNLRNVYGNVKTLAGENGVHDRDVLMSEVSAHGENEDARDKRRRGGAGRRVCGRR